MMAKRPAPPVSRGIFLGRDNWSGHKAPEPDFNPNDLVAGMTLYLAHLLHRIEALQAEIDRLKEDRP